MKKIFTLVIVLAFASVAFGIGLPGGLGGGSLNTAKLDALLAKIDGINTDFAGIYTKVKAANDAIAAVEAAHNMSGALTDPAKLVALAQALTPAEKTSMQTQLTNLGTVVTALTTLQGKIPTTLQEVPTVLTDLTTQASSNPTLLTQVNTLTGKLNAGKAKLETTGTSATSAMTETAKLTDTLKTLTVGK